MLGDERRVQLRLLGRLIERVDALDRDAHGPERHDEEYHRDCHCSGAHLLHEFDEIEPSFLCKRRRAQQDDPEPSNGNLTQLPTFHVNPPEKIHVTEYQLITAA